MFSAQTHPQLDLPIRRTTGHRGDRQAKATLWRIIYASSQPTPTRQPSLPHSVLGNVSTLSFWALPIFGSGSLPDRPGSKHPELRERRGFDGALVVEHFPSLLATSIDERAKDIPSPSMVMLPVP
ncbi:hypothetical protein ZHAS_00018506 [Anopheles sinensis]|uniref:Uncharacterized protein n=1 Tax=Anopheles sinensis TaxID=74873 RepID=A0A084WJB1_ANOSI|nr:hypothetical protein ZHAS_00018506 [Anopheles sinensis]